MSTFSNDAIVWHPLDAAANPAVVIDAVTSVTSQLDTTLVSPETGDPYPLV